LDLCSLLWL